MTHPLLAALQPTVLEQIRLTVVVPTYNEADNLPAMAAALFALPFPRLQLLVVDDNSPDGTGQVADALAARYNVSVSSERPRVKVIHRPGKSGLGTAYVAGMQCALADGAEYVLQMDADFSHSPAYIPQMLGVMWSSAAAMCRAVHWMRDGGRVAA